jgi:hypothetical protein
MISRREALFACGIFALSTSARTQESPASNDDELRKLSTTLDFICARKAQDYLIAMPDSIDQAKYVKIGGIE